MRLRLALVVLVAALLSSTGGQVLATVAAPGRTASLPSCAAAHWVASWTAVPSDGLADVPPVNQTYRIQVVPHSDGSVARLRFSNRFGIGPVTFGAVTLGTQGSGATLTAGSLRTVTFAGHRRVRIARGADITSDPVTIPVRAFRTLLASVYVGGTPGPATEHVLAGQTTWQSAPLSGDRTRVLSGRTFVGTPIPGVTPAIPQGVPYLSGFDVRAPGRTGVVVAFGDSITDGFQGELAPVLPVASTINLNRRYPDDLARRLLDAGSRLSVVNAGISGNEILRNSVVPIFGPAGVSRFERDALDQPGVGTVIVLEGINDIGQSQARPAALIAGYNRVIALAHARGVRILLGTLTPDEGTLEPGYGTPGEPTRVAVNAWIRTQHAADGIIDFDKAVRDPSHPARQLKAYDGGDQIHFTPAGYQAMADAVPLGELTAPACR